MSSPKRKPTPDEWEKIKARVRGLSHEEIVQAVTRTKPILEHKQDLSPEGRAKDKAPETDDELWEAIKRDTGFEIPRVRVCPDHQAPFEFISDAYFERETALFQVGSREMGKTLGVSIVHYMNSKFKKGCESITFGAIEAQAKRAYEHIKSFIYDTDNEGKKTLRPEVEGEPLRGQTNFKFGGKIELIVGTKSGVNSPHPQKVHADEVDLMELPVWNESRNMSSSKVLYGKRIAAQDFATSTRKSVHGIVQKILDDVAKNEKQGYEPAWKIYTSCVFEAAEEVPECRRAPDDERVARLKELGMDPCSLCSCDRVVKGEWDEDNPRTLDTVCGGKFFRSRGWMVHTDVKRKFRQNDQATWEAQMECRKPMADGLYLPGWRRERFTVIDWMPRPELGQVFQGIDWGGSAESAILWIQGPLRVPVETQGAHGTISIPRDSYVVFDEYLEADIGTGKLADNAYAREVKWRRLVPGFRVTARFADMAGKQQRDDWREHEPPMTTVWWLPDRNFDPTVRTLQDLVGDKRYWVSSKCSRHMDDIESWRREKGREVHDASTHTMAASRYAHANLEARMRRTQFQDPGNQVEPVVVQRGQPSSGVAVAAGNSNSFAGEWDWRSRMLGAAPGGR